MATGELYRANHRNAHGDPVDDNGQVIRIGVDGTHVGTINGLVLGGPSWQSANNGTVDTTGLVGVPARESVQPMHADLLVIDGIRYRVQGPPQWGSRGLVTSPPRYRWWTVTATAN